MVRERPRRDPSFAALGAPPVEHFSWWRAVVAAGAFSVAGAAVVVAVRVIEVTASVDPWLAWTAAISLCACVLVMGWRLLCSTKRFFNTVCVFVGLMPAWIVAHSMGPRLRQEYLARRCLARSPAACDLLFVDGLPARHGEVVTRALVPACEYGLESACYSLLRVDPDLACQLSLINCHSPHILPELSRRACGLVASSCVAPAAASRSHSPPRSDATPIRPR